MRFHLPSFLHYLSVGLPPDIAYFHHNHLVRLLASFPVKQEMLQALLKDVILSAVRCPLGTPTRTEEESLFETPPDAHMQTLADTLDAQGVSVVFGGKSLLREGRGARTIYEYRIDTRAIHACVTQVRFACDVSLVLKMLEGNYYVSLRMLRGYIKCKTGYVLSNRRLTPVLEHLEHEGVLKKGRNVQYCGRAVVSKRSGLLQRLKGVSAYG